MEPGTQRTYHSVHINRVSILSGLSKKRSRIHVLSSSVKMKETTSLHFDYDYKKIILKKPHDHLSVSDVNDILSVVRETRQWNPLLYVIMTVLVCD